MPPPRTRPWERATRITGRLLCWSLGTAMLLNALQGLAHPALPGFRQLWLGAWIVTGGLLLGWAALRAVEKTAAPGPRSTGGPSEEPHTDALPGFDQAA